MTMRGLKRHPLMSLLAVFSLSIGLSAALMSMLLVRQELGYEHFIPGHAGIYLAASGIASADRPTFELPQSPAFLAALMRRQFPEIERTARIVGADVRLKHGDSEAHEKIYWADPDFFHIFPLKTLYGDLGSSLQRADGIVITRSIAAKYFAEPNPVGQVLLLDGEHAERVEAVIEDLPTNSTMLESGIFASGAAVYSGLSQCDRDDEENARQNAIGLCGLTFFQLRTGTDIGLIRSGETDLARSFPVQYPLTRTTIPVLRLDEVHLYDGFNPGGRDRLRETAAIGLLVLFAACLVYVSLSTARAARRGVEVGIRKVCGAGQGELILQFLGESLLTACFAGILAVSLTELLLPDVNAILDAHLSFEYWREPRLLAFVSAAILTIGMLSGAYPAFLLSGFRPTEVLKGGSFTISGVSVREILVVVQCAILIGLIAASFMIFKQRDFAVHAAIKLRTDDVLVVHSQCADSFVDRLRNIHGVTAVICSRSALLDDEAFDHLELKDGTPITMNWIETDYAAFRFYGVPLIAGVIDGPSDDFHVVINESARRALRLPTATTAIGTSLELKDGDGVWVGSRSAGAPSGTAAPPITIVGVVPDFTLEAAMHTVQPTLYWPLKHLRGAGDPKSDSTRDFVHLKLNGTEIPQTLQSIDALWQQTVGKSLDSSSNINRFFLQDYVESHYQTVLKQGQIFAGFSILAVILASLGLLGLAAAAAERRTKEIGIRKALGAGQRDILLMLLAQFSRPVLWASLLAWPISGVLIHRWLQGFVQHTNLHIGIFLLSSLIALVISLLTVLGHAWRVSGAKPIAALRYE